MINQEAAAYLDSLYRPPSPELAALRESAEARRVPVILRDTEALLLNLLRVRAPENILEIGTAVGYSACCFAVACPQARIWTVEYREQMAWEAEKNIEALGLSHRIRVLFGDARQVLSAWDTDLKIDFAFIDGGKSHYGEFFEQLLPLCRLGAVIASDNILLRGKTLSDRYDPRGRAKTTIRNMRGYLEMLSGRTDVSTAFLPVGDGLAITVAQGSDHHEKD